jgi:hypothetical protein
MPLSPEGVRRLRKKGADPLRQEFRRELEEWNDYQTAMDENQGSSWTRERPRDPRKNKKFKQYWEEDL